MGMKYVDKNHVSGAEYIGEFNFNDAPYVYRIIDNTIFSSAGGRGNN